MNDVNAPSLSLENVRVRLVWLLVFRTIVTTVLLVTALLLRVTSNEPLFTTAAFALYAVATASYVAILVGALWIRRNGTYRVVGLAYSQLAFDALTMTILIALTGGVESIFAFVYTLTVLNAAALLGRRGALILAAGCVALYGVVLVAQGLHLFRPMGLEIVSFGRLLPTFFTNVASFVLIAILGAYLTEQLKQTSVNLDVTRAQMARLEELYLAVLESLPSGVLTVDAQSRVVYVNAAGAEILGIRPSDVVGRRLDESAKALDAAGIEENERFERVHRVGEVEKTLGGSGAQLTGSSGIAGRVIVFQDLTELRRLQGEVLRSENLAELGRLSAGLAHEIRNPLAAMIGCLQLLRSDAKLSASSPDAERMLSIVHREAERLSSLVSTFLTYARPAPATIENVDVLALTLETVDVCRARHGEHIVYTVDGPTVIAQCDANQIRQVLWNLIGNAEQILMPQDGEKRIALLIAADARYVYIAVDDNGPGVNDDVKSRIFEPFFTTRPEGTGLGLATVHQVLRQQRGKISLSKSPLGGARFLVRLPRSESDPNRSNETNDSGTLPPMLDPPKTLH